MTANSQRMRFDVSNGYCCPEINDAAKNAKVVVTAKIVLDKNNDDVL